PANPKKTWTGRGKQPRWLAAHTAKGKKPEDFLIKK
ncbi:MAG TPA: DNA-binding protein, partial [Stenotrophomonas sp.]|nr:DNA-binding protein [Stenotrophomonas sp.]